MGYLPYHYKFPINLLGHVADFDGFFTRGPSLIWNTDAQPLTLWLHTLAILDLKREQLRT